LSAHPIVAAREISGYCKFIVVYNESKEMGSARIRCGLASRKGATFGLCASCMASDRFVTAFPVSDLYFQGRHALEPCVPALPGRLNSGRMPLSRLNRVTCAPIPGMPEIVFS
jgi:hypothetical protein